MFTFFLEPDFLKSLKKITPSDQILIKNKLVIFQSSENPLFLSKKLKEYKDRFRFRVGNYRLIFRLEKNTIIFLTVKHRKDIYRGL